VLMSKLRFKKAFSRESQYAESISNTRVILGSHIDENSFVLVRRRDINNIGYFYRKIQQAEITLVEFNLSWKEIVICWELKS